MLSEQEWAKLLPKINKALEKSKGPTSRWAHRPLWGFVLQLVAELEETRDLLSRQGWVHQKDVLERVRSATHRAYSAASDVEDAADELRDAAEEMLGMKPITIDRSQILNQLMLAIQQHHTGEHYGGFQFCNYPICEEARRFDESDTS